MRFTDWLTDSALWVVYEFSMLQQKVSIRTLHRGVRIN